LQRSPTFRMLEMLSEVEGVELDADEYVPDFWKTANELGGLF